jgi:asparagine synthase (glutamine-hydrolysing)
MCGICGILYFDKDQNVNELTLRRMCNVIFHRGPDAEGVFLNGNIGLGIRRLKIIDLEGGNQPIFNEDRSVVVVLNGEIYNFWELREELEGKGHKFYTASDTEVIVHAYEEYGEQCVQKLDGMFAFAIWDENNRRLFFARDRIGIKPLYYTVTDEKLLFGSEVKAILLEGTVMRSVDLESLHHYLSLNYVPGEKTMFRGIVKLLPGHYLVVEAGALSVHRYWDVEYSRSDDPIYDESYYCERLLELLKESVKRHMISDVPIGVLLSGGIDSSTVLALAAQLVDRPIKTFSIGFHEKTYSELPYASVVAKHFRTEHQ